MAEIGLRMVGRAALRAVDPLVVGNFAFRMSRDPFALGATLLGIALGKDRERGIECLGRHELMRGRGARNDISFRGYRKEGSVEILTEHFRGP